MDKKQITLTIKKIDGVEVKMQAKDLALKDFKALDDVGTFEAHVSVFGNVDSYGEIVDKGAFVEWLTQYAGRYPKGVWAHNWDEPIIKTLECREDDIGLYVKGQFVLEVQRAREIYALMKAGVITDFSFGFQVLSDEMGTDGFRHLTKIAIYEYSPVLVGANREAELLGVKSGVEKKDEEDESGIQKDAEPAAEAPAPVVGDEPAPAAADSEAGKTPGDEAIVVPATEEGKNGPTMAEKLAVIVAATKAAVDLTTALESLKGELEDSPAATGEDTSKIEGREGKGESDTTRVVKAILRDARKADKIVESIIIRAKRI